MLERLARGSRGAVVLELHVLVGADLPDPVLHYRRHRTQYAGGLHTLFAERYAAKAPKSSLYFVLICFSLAQPHCPETYSILFLV